MKRIFTCLLALCLLLPALAPGASAQQAALMEQTPSRQSASRYTAVKAPGAAHTLYAFTDQNGQTQYRVYGRLNNQTGFFEAKLLAPQAEGGDYALQILGEKPLRDQTAQFAQLKAPKLQADTQLPSGFSLGKSRGLLMMRNYFNRSEYLAYATLDGQSWQYYHTDGSSRAMRGGLPVLPDSLLERAMHFQRYLLPDSYRQALQLPARYQVLTSDGQPVVLSGAVEAVPENMLMAYIQPTAAPTKAPDDKLPLSRGSRGALVRSVQVRLAALQYAPGYADGIYGKQTASAVSAFQQAAALRVTGILDQASHDRLMAADAPVNPSPAPSPTPAPTLPPSQEASYTGNYRARAYTSGGLLNLWSIPNPTKQAKYSIAKIPFGTVLTGVQKGNNGFSKLIYEGKEGYVDTGYLLFEPVDTATYEGKYNAKIKTTGGELNLWIVPNPQKLAIYSILKIPNGTLLEKVEKGNQGFSRVTYKEKTGFLDNKFLDFTVPQPTE